MCQLISGLDNIQDPVLGERLEKIFVRFQRLAVGEATLEFVSTMLY